MEKNLLIFIFILDCQIAIAQNRITITDPEIKFSIEAPLDWIKYDDGYYYYLIIPSEAADENLSITYLETKSTLPDSIFEFTINQIYPLNEPGYNLLETGDESINNLSAKWAIFTSIDRNVHYKRFIFMFIEHGQIFKIQGTSRLENFDAHVERFRSIIKSIRIEKL